MLYSLLENINKFTLKNLCGNIFSFNGLISIHLTSTMCVDITISTFLFTSHICFYLECVCKSFSKNSILSQWQFFFVYFLDFWKRFLGNIHICLFFLVFISEVSLNEVWCNCSADRSARLFIIEISSNKHIKWKQPQRIFF